MRRLTFLAVVALLLFVSALPAPEDTKAGDIPYKIVFNKGNDVAQSERDKEGKEGLFITVKFGIKLDGTKAGGNVADEYKLVIEENGHRVKEVELPRPPHPTTSASCSPSTPRAACAASIA